MSIPLTFDEVFKIWFDNEVTKVEGRDLLPVALGKGFTSIAEWRLANALRFGMDKMQWALEKIDNPGEVLPSVIIGPYRGWSIQKIDGKEVNFFDNQLSTTFEQALEIPEFFEFCREHDRIIPLSQKFPLPTSIILFRKAGGQLIHVEGGHRMCAVAYAKKIGQPIKFDGQPPVSAAVASITENQFESLRQMAKQGTEKVQ